MDDELYCPPAGKRVSILESADDTDGDFVTFEMSLDADSRGPYRHVHPRQDETLAVESGRLGVWVDGERRILTEGERVEIPRGVPHRFWNESEETTRLRGELRPARRSEEFLPLAFALARDHPATKGGVPLNPLAVAVLFDEYEDYYYFAYVPVRLQKLGVGLLAPIGKLLGYEPDLSVIQDRDGARDG